MNEMTGNATIVDTLDIDALPAGQESRLLIEMAQDGFGMPVHVPVIVMRGVRPGPVLGLTAAIHGDELNGIPVIHRLFERLDPKTLRGTVIALIVANIPAFRAQRRLFSVRADLNHIMPGRPDGSAAEVYAHRIIDRIVRHFDVLIDMHTASLGRANSLYIRADLTDATTARMAYLQRPQIIVHNPPSDGTLRGAAMDMGIPSITVEIGDPRRFQHELIRRSLVGLRAVMADLKMIPKRRVALGEAPLICSRSMWLYTDRGGLLEVTPKVNERITAAQSVAHLTNIFGDRICEYYAPESGVVIGKSVHPVGTTGARILHLGIPATEAEKEHYHMRDALTQEAI